MSLIQSSLSDRTWPAWLRERPFWWSSVWDDLAETSSIRVEEYEEDDVYVIRAEAPGIDPDEDIDLTVKDSVLRLDIRRHHGKKESKRKHHRTEFSYGSFSRLVTLPRMASEKDVSAEYENGILEIRVPLNGKDADAHHVPIRHA
jgi:HSP20 family molecular chaperone IbpA